ncbi:mannose-1-phosphate guanylyltransferase/mannose-6-phosphate isomerase [Marinivivus vitaminiproducens]|uniref:mannose-1-phosphate guanylyltransferase/mannose-6-phosphate isomerase n=1 Tax=Marinivivus vitaminiproducens TaxID=3035935 RepID=UPI0027A2904F|nr:mannose-1-phosphate guanylyltransferase/mannose-6-phosphate isomerase [Geminicoccaceae bacterium SCSIO 64248]
MSLTPAPLVPVLMAGGSGTRLWPFSREAMPKQLVSIIGDETLLQQTARRFLELAPAGSALCVSAAAQGHVVRQQLAAVDAGLSERIILEPVGRNTAAAIALAALHTSEQEGADALLWVCPADHLIKDVPALIAAARQGMPAARAGSLVTFGITPSRPDTGFGYIKLGEPLAEHAGVRRCAAFVEKPKLEIAERMLAEGSHAWNSGIFLFRADVILDELRRHAPAVLEAVEAAWSARAHGPDGMYRLPAETFEAVPSEPIDKAVMERSDKVVVVEMDPGWSDLGSWQAVWEELPRDADGNAVVGDGLAVDSAGCLVRSSRRLVVAAGVENLAVIETDDAVLVAPRDNGNAVRSAVQALNAADRPETRQPAAERRPWGSFQVLQERDGFKVKEIIVEPGAILSLQSHKHRAEHWTVVRGLARVTVDGEITDLQPNQSVHIPLGAIHRMANPGTTPMHIIEVQCGSYTGEDDIVRYEDAYGRS